MKRNFGKSLRAKSTSRRSRADNNKVSPRAATEHYDALVELIQGSSVEEVKSYLEHLKEKERSSVVLEVDQYGWTLFHNACQLGKLEIGYALLQAGCDIHAITKDDTTGLHYLSKLSEDARQPIGVYKQLLAVMVSQGARLNQAKKSGETALHVACSYGNDVALTFLLGAGIDVDALTKSGDSALHYAVHANKPQIVKALLQSGARTDVTSAQGSTPEQFAGKLGLADIVSEFERHREDRQAEELLRMSVQSEMAAVDNDPEMIDKDVVVTTMPTEAPTEIIGCWEEFRRSFFGKRCFVYYLEKIVVLILSRPTGAGTHPSLVLHLQGFDRYEVQAENLKLYADMELPDQLQAYLATQAEEIKEICDFQPVGQWQRLKHASALNEILVIESRLTPPRRICVGLVYGRKNQTKEEEFFTNRSHHLFDRFLGIIGLPIEIGQWKGFQGTFRDGDEGEKAYYTCWRGFEFIFHVAPFLSAGMQRQHVGNDTALIVFKEGPETPLAQFRGQVNSVAIVVKPSPKPKAEKKSKRTLAISTYHRTRIDHLYEPVIPKEALAWDTHVVRDYIFSNVVNGVRAALRSKPYSNNNAKLFADAISTLIASDAQK